MSPLAIDLIAGLIGAIGDTMDGALLLVDADGRVVACNGRARALLGREGGGFDLRSTLPPGSPVAELVQRSIATGAKIDLALEGCPLTRRQGQYRLRVQPVDGSQGQRGAVVRVEAVGETPLQTLVAWRQLAAGAAHEIRNPLAGVRGFLQLLDKRLEGEEEKRYLSIVLREIDRVSDLTRQLMAIAKPVARQGRWDCLPAIARDALESVRARAIAQGVALELVTDELGACQGSGYDRERLGHILLNLLHNALDAMPNGGRITVTCRGDPVTGSSCVEVSDTGPGIPAEHLPHIFEPYFTTKATGTGLGLALCQRFAEDMGGFISVETHPGLGTTFRVILPVSCSQAPAGMRSRSPSV